MQKAIHPCLTLSDLHSQVHTSAVSLVCMVMYVTPYKRVLMISEETTKPLEIRQTLHLGLAK